MSIAIVFSATQMTVRTLQAKESRQAVEEQSEVADDADVAKDAWDCGKRCRDKKPLWINHALAFFYRKFIRKIFSAKWAFSEQTCRIFACIFDLAPACRILLPNFGMQNLAIETLLIQLHESSCAVGRHAGTASTASSLNDGHSSCYAACLDRLVLDTWPVAADCCWQFSREAGPETSASYQHYCLY